MEIFFAVLLVLDLFDAIGIDRNCARTAGDYARSKLRGGGNDDLALRLNLSESRSGRRESKRSAPAPRFYDGSLRCYVSSLGRRGLYSPRIVGSAACLGHDKDAHR